MDESLLLERLVARYSPSDREAPAVKEFVKIARELGYRAQIDAVGNGIARRGLGHPSVAFLGHVDTVEGRLPVRCTRTRVSGRGAVDAKGALVAALVAGRDFKGPGELVVLAAVGEEKDSRGARHLLPRLRPDAVIAGEPSGWDGVAIGYKGELQVEAAFRGSRTHYSSPSPTTIDTAVEWVAAVRAFAQARTTDTPFRSLSAKVVGFASRGHGDEETARITVDLRIPPGSSTREVLRALPTEPGRPRLTTKIRVEPVEVERTNPVVAALVAGIRSLGARPILWRKSGTSDLNLVLPVWKVPGAAYGPGDARLDHTARESLPTADLARSVAVLQVAFERLHAGGSTPRRAVGGA